MPNGQDGSPAPFSITPGETSELDALKRQVTALECAISTFILVMSQNSMTFASEFPTELRKAAKQRGLNMPDDCDILTDIDTKGSA